MKKATYSTYDAKARFSEILRKVRAGERVSITYRGKEVAEIRPVIEEETVEERLRKLEERGIGRPSTYASIIETIIRRAYVFKKGSALVPT